MGVSEIHLIDDRQHGNLEQDGMQPRALDTEINLARWQCLHRDVFLIQMEQAQKMAGVLPQIGTNLPTQTTNYYNGPLPGSQTGSSPLSWLAQLYGGSTPSATPAAQPT